jgi:hypothetical protein
LTALGAIVSGGMGGSTWAAATIGAAVAANPAAPSDERKERRLTRPAKGFCVWSKCTLFSSLFMRVSLLLTLLAAQLSESHPFS